jgi:hypothetical protein
MTGRTAPRVSGRGVAWLAVAAGLLIFAAANAHLVYVAVSSEPDCVPHWKAPGEGGYRAAKSSC